MDIGGWLRGLGLDQYDAAFRDNAIDETILPSLTAEDLKDLGVKIVGHRRRLLDAIAALRTDADAKASPPQASPKIEGVPHDAAERRQVTVLFSDLVGSTALSSRMDPEDLREVIAAYHKCVTEIVRRFDGFVAKYLGDGVLVYFGYPQAHEDDAERAVMAGLELVAAVAELKTQAMLQARVGIATGLVVVGDLIGSGEAQERGIVGETPNLAARLQGLAEPNAVVIATDTRRLVGALFEYRDLGSLEVKGIARPVPAWQVVRPNVVPSRFEALRGSTLTPLIGRDEEIDLLLRRWARAKSGEGQMVLLSGEPGIGKSRIAESLLVRIEGEPHARLRYFCSPHHTHSPLYPFIAQLERAAGFEPGSSASAKLDKLEALLKPSAANVPPDVGLIADLLAVPTDRRYPALAVSPQQKREMTLTALLNQLDGLAAQSPVLIVFEDIHWIDPTSLDLLDRTVARIVNLPVLVLVTVRPEYQSTWVGQPHVTMLSLNRLGRRDAAGIIAGMTKGKALPDVVAEQVLAQTDGVPLFIEELTSTLLESGLMRETSDGYVLDGPLPPLAIPTTLQASLAARLDRLAPVKDVAQIGAAIGREFSHELIGAVASLTPGDLDAALERLTASGLISRRGTPPVATYSFKHALVQDAAYATLLKSRRRQLHASIAKVLVDQFRTLADTQPEVVAHHFTEAGLASEAISYWRKAGQLASGRSANSEAVRSFEHALGVLETLPENQDTLGQGFDIRLELRSALIPLGETRRMLAHLREAEVLAERLNDDQRRGRVCAVMTNLHSRLGELDEAFATGTRALEIAGRLGDLRLRILTTTYLEQIHYYRGEYAHVVELATENLAALPADWVYEYFEMSAPASVFARYWLVMSLAQLGRFAEAAEHEAEGLRLAEPTRHAFTVGLAHFAAGTLHVLKGEWVQARALFEHWITVARTGNVALHLPWALAFSAWVLAQLGEASEALSRLGEGEQLLKRQAAGGIVSSLGWAFHALGRACLLLDRLDEAQSLADQAIESSAGHHGFVAHAVQLLGDIATHPDRFDAERGEAHYRRALALAEPRGMRPLVAHCHLGLGKLLQRIGKSAEAEEHCITATTMCREMDMPLFCLDEAVRNDA